MTAHPIALVDQLDAVLPQTQCTQCGFEGCLPYARAIVQAEAPINRCPPGGQSGVVAMADVLGIAPVALDLERGQPAPLTLAVIEEAHCIGCTLCIAACPVDAIVGANKRMHTVIDEACTGCGLCVAPCPVDCIEMVPAQRAWTSGDALAAKVRHEHRNQRLARTRAGKSAPLRPAQTEVVKQAAISDALARARARRGNRSA